MKPIEGKYLGYGIVLVGFIVGAVGFNLLDSPGGSGVSQILILIGGIVIIGGFILAAIYWICPYCKVILWGEWHISHCQHCGKSIDVPRFKK